MGLIVGLVFLGVFAVAALLMTAIGTRASQRDKQTLASLDTALGDENQKKLKQILNLRKSELLSVIPWLNRSLQKFDLAPRLHTLLYQADLKWTAGGLLAMCTTCFVLPAYLIYRGFGSILLALPIGLLLSAAPFAWALHKRTKRLDRFQQGLPEALGLMVSALRAGQSLGSSMGLVAHECADPVGCEFKECFEEQNYGLELRTAMDNMIVRVPLQDLRIIATAITIQKESGGNLAEILEKTAYVIQERFRLKRQVSVHTAQGRMTGWILTILPIALGIALYFANPEMMSVLWKTPIGVKLLWTAAGMLVLGGLIIRHIVNMDV
jgi:tight adherence protein B